MRKEPIKIFGDGEQTRDFVYIDDIVDGWARALTSDAASGAIINLGSGRSLSIKQLQPRHRRVRPHLAIRVHPCRGPGGEQRTVQNNVSKARSTGMDAGTTFDAAWRTALGVAEFAAMPAPARIWRRAR